MSTVHDLEVHGASLGGPDAPVVVLAGATGTGKTMLATELARRGAFVIDADRVGHETLLDPRVRTAVVTAFGPAILDAEDEIDRRALGSRVFAEPAARALLDHLVHPPLVAEISRRIDHLRASRAVKLVVIDAALWWQFEPAAARPHVDLVVMTHADRDTRRARIMARDGLDAVAAQARIDAQEAIEASLHRADAVLDTAVERATLIAALIALLDRRFDLRWGESAPTAS